MEFGLFSGPSSMTLIFSIFNLFVITASAQCLHDQEHLLLQLKTSLTYDSSLSTKVVQWNESTDCCQWRGVKCDLNGRVTDLDLSGESISAGIDDTAAGGSLFRLEFLQSLNLAKNYLGSVNLPTGFGKLEALSYLNLSDTGFSGQIPLEFSGLKRLDVLDLSSSFYSSLQLGNPDLGTFIQNFTKVRELYLDGVNISATGHAWCNAISSSLPDLRVLSLSNCYLTGPFDSSLAKLKSLSVLRLDGNTFSSEFPKFFAGFPNLRVLTLSSCNLWGLTPGELFQLPSLQTIDLSNNRDLEGSLPEFPLDASLQNLLLGYTKFSGYLTDSIGGLRMLSSLDLRSCNFSGSVPKSITNLTRIVYLDLSLNQFIGSVPSFSLWKNVTGINFRSNRLTGEIFDSLWDGLENLNFLVLSENLLKGKIPETLFFLPSLKSLDLSNNQFSGQIGDSVNSSSSLEVLELNANYLEGPVPHFLFELQNLSSLSLSSNKFNGSVDLTDFRKLKNLTSLELSYNNLSVHVGENASMSSLFPRLGTLRLASCKLQKVPSLKNHSSLMMLDLSDNQLDGEIPNWIWDIGFLRFVNLSHNRFRSIQGPYTLRGLDFLDLHSNMLSGQIPVPTPPAYRVDLSSNNFSSFIPVDIGHSLSYSLSFSVANNKIIGAIPSSLCNASRLQVLDLSNNRLIGIIPSCLFGNNLGVLNISRNHFSGTIPDSFPVTCALETLDLSWNMLKGEVPKSLTNCTNLEVLNLGNNNLTGSFPCWLKRLPRLRILNLSFNAFYGNSSCLVNRT
ncbi:receptor-like protein 6 [Primulina tabacum]|uniref:receptor-like protein 6 n=1 Tax=Primulina tabacum TaxID=48773 RepID=UPI003F5AB462